MKTIALAVIVAATSIASATPIHWTELLNVEEPFDVSRSGPIVIDVSGMASWGFQGDPVNETLEILIGANVSPFLAFYNLNITTVGSSWADELTIGIEGNSIIVNPGAGDSFSVTNMNYQGSINTNFMVGADGILDLEIYEVGFDDNAGAIDAFFEPGSTITLVIPAPGALAALGLGGLIATRRKRSI